MITASNNTPNQSQNNRSVLIVGLLLTLVLIAAAFLRFRGLFWGEYQYLHPDERFMIWVGTDISPVESFGEYWDTANSSLNPHNRGHGFYVYGTLPLYLARYAVEWVYGHSGFNEMTNVGRFLSALADTLTVLFVFLIGERVYSKRVGLLAAGLSAFAVLQIQHSHFFTVDTFTVLFSMVAVYFAVRIAYDPISHFSRRQDSGVPQQGEVPGRDEPVSDNGERLGFAQFIKSPFFLLSLGFGVALGLAVSSKVSVAPLAIMLPAAMLLRLSAIRGLDQRRWIWHLFGYLVLAGFFSLLTFRIFQPMAFSGPGFFGVTPNAAWVANLRELQTQASGDVDFPPALQWARRPVWFAWENMVRWGMGFPMGILAWTGFLWVGWRMIRGEVRDHILLWGWTALIFVWQSLIFNPSMRYQMPIYPILAIFAAWAVFRIFEFKRLSHPGAVEIAGESSSGIDPADKSGFRRRNPWFRWIAIIVGASVLVATALYAFAFSNIYARPITRVEASRWIYQNIPGPISLPIQTNEGEYLRQISYPYNYQISQELPFVSNFKAVQSGTLSEIQLYRVIDPRANFGNKSLEIRVSDVPLAGRQAASTNLDFEFSPGNLEDQGLVNSIFEFPLPLAAGEEYFVQLSLLPGEGPISLDGELEFIIQSDDIHQERLSLNQVLIDSIQPNILSFTSPVDGNLVEVRLNALPPDAPSEKTLRIEIKSQPDSTENLAMGRFQKDVYDGLEQSGFRVPLDHPLELDRDQEYFLKISLEDSVGSLILRGAAVANEGAWDDGLPVRLDGYDGYAGIYEPGLNFDMYEDDNPNKLSRFYQILDHTEYILFSSSRQWGTLPRIPERFPMSSVYYRSLLGCPPEHSIEWCYNAAQVGEFEGELGFELVEVFQSNPSIGSFELNDQASEEAFTVYDHPKVFIFQKTQDYDAEKVRQLLGAVDLSRVQHITPKKAGDLPRDMMLPLDRLVTQLEGGTWSQLFNIDSWINRWPVVTVLIWYLSIAFLGLIAYPIIRFIFIGLSDRGYPLARSAGMLFLSYLVWLAGSNKIPFNRTTILIGVLFLGVISAVMIYLQRESMKQEWKERRTYFLVIEGLFLVLFLVDLLIRIGNPDLWHPWKGGEKPMDFSYLNAVLKSTSFPPYDPWFSGGYINYYYYGFVYLGVLVKGLGITPSVAYNLIIPTIFSMIVLGAFSIGWNLVNTGKMVFEKVKALIISLPFLTGIAAGLAVGVLGNLGTLRMISQGYQKLAAPDGNIAGVNFVIRLFWTVKGALLSLTGASLPYGIADWYWLPSRAIPAPNDVEPITEFPYFTVLYGDPHAHLFALPITLLALSWALGLLFARPWIIGQKEDRRKPVLWLLASLLMGGLAIGALRPTNTWDFPIYLALGLVAAGYWYWKNGSKINSSSGFQEERTTLFKRIIILVGILTLLGISAFLLFQPYAEWYVQGYTSIAFWQGTHTPFWSYITHWGVFLFVIISWMSWETREWMANTPLVDIRKLAPYKALIILAGVIALIWIIIFQFIGIGIAWFVIPMIIWSGLLLFQPGIGDQKRAILFLIVSGLSLTLMVEIIVLVGDIGRMNTVFKFYLQVWTLLGVSAAAGFGWTLAAFKQFSKGWQFTWKMVVILLVASAALYPLLGTTAKIKDRMTDGVPLTLDGMAFMQVAQYDDLGTRMDLSQDYAAIRWLQQNVAGSPVIIEGNMVEYHWGTRNTIYTGLPNVVGWNWHQRQQRATGPEDLIQGRISEVNEFYLTTDPDRVADILEKYGIKYVIVGQLEKALYPGEGLNKFPQLEGLLWKEVFKTGETSILQVLR